jgi:hypothetical protein
MTGSGRSGVNRRKFLASTGAAVAVGVAGCSEEEGSADGGSGGDNSGDGGGSGDGGDDSTPTATEQPVYGIGEAFTVGSGDKTVEYTVNSVDAYNTIGSDMIGEDASGVFVVVVLEMTNQSDETIDVSSNHLKLVDDQDREFDANAGAGAYVESDDRITAEGFAFEQLNPGLSTSGAVIYDVSPGTTYELLVEPVGIFSTANSKRVDLGEITAP